MTPRLRWLILGSALVGLGVASASTWVHYRLLTDPTYISPCDVAAAFNCSQVYLSPYGSVGGVPVAIAGMLWFGVVALIAGFGRTDGRPSAAGAYLMSLSVIGLAVSLYLGYVSFTVLKTGCLLCMATYACVLVILVLSSRATSVPIGSLPGRIAGDLAGALSRPPTLAASLLLVAGMLALVVLFPREGSLDLSATDTAQPPTAQTVSTTPGDPSADPFTQWWSKQTRIDLGIPADGARVIVVKFNDFLCGTCGRAHFLYKPVLDRFAKSHPGAVRLVVKDWPWDVSCNFNAGRTIPGHEAACAAAAAARMAADRGKYDEMATWLYQQGRSAQDIRATAAKLLGVTDFDREYALKLQDIRRDISDGGALGVAGTPTYFINGVRINELLQPAQFERAISLELQR